MRPAQGGNNVESLANGGVSVCPAEKVLADQSRFDLSRGYIPVFLATALFAGGVSAAFEAGGWLETLQQERSAVLERLGKIEAKLDTFMGKAVFPQREKVSRHSNLPRSLAR
jgi:hypothetical protein